MCSPAFVMRQIGKKDYPKLCCLIQAVNDVDDSDYSLDKDWFSCLCQEHQKDIFTIVEQEQMLAIAIAMIAEMEPRQATIHLLVHPDWRQQGIGTALYARMEKHLRQRAVTYVECCIKKQLLYAVYFAHQTGFLLDCCSTELILQLDDFATREQSGYCLQQAAGQDRQACLALSKEAFGYCAEEQSFQDPSILLYAIKKGTEVLATVSLQRKPDLKRVYLFDFVVQEVYRRQGLGRCCLELCLTMLKKESYSVINLVVENEQALNFYRQLGFAEKNNFLMIYKKI